MVLSEASGSVGPWELTPLRTLGALARLPARHGALGRLALRGYAAIRDWLWNPSARCARLRQELEPRLGRRLRPAQGRAMLDLLKREGLLAWDGPAGRYAFPEPPLEPGVSASHRADFVWNRPAPVQRAHWQQIASTRAASRNTGLLVALMRCSWRDESGALSPEGRCRARLAAELGGCHRRTAQRARSALVARETLARVPVPRSAADWDSGPRLRIVGGGAAPPERSNLPRGGRRERSNLPPTGTNTSGSPPRNEHRTGGRGRAADAVWRPGRGTRGGGGDPLPRALRLPRLETPDLKRWEGWKAVHAAAARTGHVSPGATGLLDVVALAQRALRRGERNPPGYLYSLLLLAPEARQITQAEENHARSLLRDPVPRDWARTGGAAAVSSTVASALALARELCA